MTTEPNCLSKWSKLVQATKQFEVPNIEITVNENYIIPDISYKNLLKCLKGKSIGCNK